MCQNSEPASRRGHHHDLVGLPVPGSPEWRLVQRVPVPRWRFTSVLFAVHPLHFNCTVEARLPVKATHTNPGFRVWLHL